MKKVKVLVKMRRSKTHHAFLAQIKKMRNQMCIMCLVHHRVSILYLKTIVADNNKKVMIQVDTGNLWKDVLNSETMLRLKMRCTKLIKA